MTLSEIKRTTTSLLQLSSRLITSEISAAGISLKHCKSDVGLVSPVGGVVSSMKNRCTTFLLLPAQSSNLYVLVTTVGSLSPPSHTTEVTSSPEKVIVISLLISQLSARPVTNEISAAGSSPKH